MKVLVACEFSGTVRDAFKARGHEALSCDLLPTESPGEHHQGDIRDVLYDEWDLIIAHPPCQYITNSGVRWLYQSVDGKRVRNQDRWDNLDAAAAFFRLFSNHPCERVCIENPIPHKYALARIGKKYSQIIQPWQFGHTEKKATCLWLKGLPPLQETHNVKEEMSLLPRSEQQKTWYASPSKDRWKKRSVTFSGIAEAMASQWGDSAGAGRDRTAGQPGGPACPS